MIDHSDDSVVCQVPLISHFIPVCWGCLRLDISKHTSGCYRTGFRSDSLSRWGMENLCCHPPQGRNNSTEQLLHVVCVSLLCQNMMSSGNKISVKYDNTLTMTSYFTENISATGYQRPQTHIMNLSGASAAIKPHLQYQHSILQIIHSLPWILLKIRALPGDRENGSIWAFQTHSQGAVLVLVQSPASPVRLLYCS